MTDIVNFPSFLQFQTKFKAYRFVCKTLSLFQWQSFLVIHEKKSWSMIVNWPKKKTSSSFKYLLILRIWGFFFICSRAFPSWIRFAVLVCSLKGSIRNNRFWSTIPSFLSTAASRNSSVSNSMNAHLQQRKRRISILTSKQLCKKNLEQLGANKTKFSNYLAFTSP